MVIQFHSPLSHISVVSDSLSFTSVISHSHSSHTSLWSITLTHISYTSLWSVSLTHLTHTSLWSVSLTSLTHLCGQSASLTSLAAGPRRGTHWPFALAPLSGAARSRGGQGRQCPVQDFACSGFPVRQPRKRRFASLCRTHLDSRTENLL